jgi:hypothetical protein
MYPLLFSITQVEPINGRLPDLAAITTRIRLSLNKKNDRPRQLKYPISHFKSV